MSNCGMSTHADVTTYLPFSGTGNAGVISIEGKVTGCCVP
jgi:hypothetical protein